MIRHLKFYITALFMIMVNLEMMAYMSNDLVGSAIEFGDVDISCFMLYFQDGNIVTFCCGIVCAIMFAMLRKKTPPVLRVIWITFALTLIVLPLYLMILGEGYRGIVIIYIYSFFLGYSGLFIILSILLVCWIISLIKTKSLKQSVTAIWHLLLKGVGTIPLTYIVALFVFTIICQLTKTWNLSQCEKYVQSQYEDFDDIATLMHQWEKEHTLQWGEAAKSHYSRSEEQCDSVAEEIKIIEKNSI